MKQVLQHLRTGETFVADVPAPSPLPGTALVRTAASLVSAGTERMVVNFAERSLLGKARSRPDLVRQMLDKARQEGVLTAAEAAFNRLDQPMPLGYASAGTIIKLGEGLRGLQVGDRVACAGGGYAVHAEYALVPANLLALLPDSVDLESAAFTTLGAIALHGFRLAEVGLGSRVVVIGLGLLGMLTAGIAAAAGCHVLGVDLDPSRVRLAAHMGAEAVLRDQAEGYARAFSRGRGCDSVLICAATSSSDPIELAGAIARDRARVVAVGAVDLEIPRKTFFEKELSVLVSRSYGPGRYDPEYEAKGRDYPIGYVRWTEGRNLEAFVDLLASGRLDVTPLITHRFPVDRAPDAYELITGKRDETYLGVLLNYPEPAKIDEAPDRSPLPKRRREDLQRESVQRVRVGALGAGNFAQAVLLPALQRIPQIELVGVASASGLSARTAADRFGFAYATGDEIQILEDEGINTVAVLTRHHLHARQVLAGLAAGKHVFCEKPLALTQEELDEIADALGQRRGGRPLLTVGFNRRFAPLARKMSTFLEGRQEPLYVHYRVNAGYLAPEHWLHDPEQGGGRIVGEVCHFIDFLTFLMGQPPISVSAQALPDGGRYRQDNVTLELSFLDGSLGTIAYLANGDKAFPKERVEVFSGGQIAVLDNFRTLEMVERGRRKVDRARFRQDKGHRAEWEAFAGAILHGGAPPIPYDQLLGTTRTTFAALQSLRTGERIKLT
jgi:predicted dehydrogenase/threonine dehydrogenase-like Zn-dependent dehydrogenase